MSPANRPSTDAFLVVSGRHIPMALVRNPRARRYLLRLRADGSARVTIPRGGSAIEARRFAEGNKDWLDRELRRHAALPRWPKEWRIGMEILFRGVAVKLEAGLNGESGMIRFGGEMVPVKDPAADLRPEIERHLRRLAAQELPPKLLEYAALHRLPLRRITVRNQKARWGSCSRRGTISLNWRLIQTPEFVRDYICLHEMVHLRQMNHSPQFWREVERVCPGYQSAEKWLKQHASWLR